MTERAVSLVDFREPLESLAIAASLRVDGQRHDGAARLLGPFHQRFGDCPVLIGIKLEPDGLAPLADDVLDGGA